jgi:RNA polymerase sigma-70 factor (ECF subfamily)
VAEGGIAAVLIAHRGAVLRLLRARGCGAEEADDIVQEMWLRIDAVRIGPVADPLAYLMRMAMNLATDRRLAAQRRCAREAGWGMVQPGASEQPDPERSAISAGELARLQALLDSMPAHMRRALVLYRMEGRSQAQIAAELGMSVSGIEKVLARAYRQLVEFRTDTPAEGPGSPARPGDRSTFNG